MKRIFHLASVTLVVLIAYAFVFSNSAVERQAWVNQNVQCEEQFSAEPTCFGSSHFANSSAGFELIDAEGNDAIQSSEPDTTESHKSCKSLRLDLPVDELHLVHLSLHEGRAWHHQSYDFLCSNYVVEQLILRI
ncbi:MAG TPA: hypothetical protein VMV56_09105 [Williamwhitmania sp.]|nr:hypothetical protein [Williamwhitmania sp.]